MNVEYGGRDHLDFVARNYVENVKREETGIIRITYERALRNLVVAMYGHYVDLFCCHTATASHVLAISTKVRAIPIEGQVDTTGIPAKAPTKSQLGRKMRAWLPS